MKIKPGALGKAWLAYIISFEHDDWERRKYYAAVIQKLEGELNIQKYSFRELRGIVADFLDEYQNDPDIQNMSIEEKATADNHCISVTI